MDGFSAKLLDRYMCIGTGMYFYVQTTNRVCKNRSGANFPTSFSKKIAPPLLLSISTFPSTSSPSTPVTKNKASRQPSRHFLAALLLLCRAILLPPKQNTQKIIIPTPIEVSNINFIFNYSTTYDPQRLLVGKLSAWNPNASVLSTRTSIFSP